MAEQSGFFRSVSGDRKYTVDFLAKWTASFLSNGVYKDNLAVTADENMQVVVPAGQAWINGYYYRNDSPLTLTLANADGVLHRKDTVVLRWDINARSITIQVLQGTPASTPTAPAIVRTAEQYDLKLAEISIPAGTTAITQSLITDTRLNNDVCGIVHAVVDHIDMTIFYQQIAADLAEFKSKNEAEFSEWFEGIKKILDENAAGHLQNEIDAVIAAKGQPNGIATLDADGHIPAAQLNMPEPNYAGKLVVHVTTSDGGSVGDTRVRITQAQLGADFIQPLDALDTTTFQLLENHVYSVVLIDYPTQYYGGADTVQIAGGTTKEITIELGTEPDIIGIDYDNTADTYTYTDGAANWIAAEVNSDGTVSLNSWEDSWLLRSMRPCMLKNGVVQYYLDPNDYRRKLDGTPSDIMSGNDGDAMVEFDRIYHRVETQATPDGHRHIHIKLSKSKLSETAYAFNDAQGVEHETMYISIYQGVTYNGVIMSISGTNATVFDYSASTSSYLNALMLCRKASGYSGLNFVQVNFIRMLFSLVFKKFNDVAFGTSSTNRGNGGANTRGIFYGGGYSKIFFIENLNRFQTQMYGAYIYAHDNSNYSFYFNFSSNFGNPDISQMASRNVYVDTTQGLYHINVLYANNGITFFPEASTVGSIYKASLPVPNQIYFSRYLSDPNFTCGFLSTNTRDSCSLFCTNIGYIYYIPANNAWSISTGNFSTDFTTRLVYVPQS